jgi:peptidoglycan/LPS O-acetylase OafA/YrhL
MDMDVERSSPTPAPASLMAELDIVKKRWRHLQSRARRALPAVCVVAATVLAFVVLSTAGDGWPTLPRNRISVQGMSYNRARAMTGDRIASFVSSSSCIFIQAS